MSSNDEIQQEEREVLMSIYDGDANFKQISDSVFQYKVGEDNASKSFITEISWPETYPEELPVINMDLFYNKHVLTEVKDAVRCGLLEQANDLLGMSMTFTLFEWVKDNTESLLSVQPENRGPSSQVENSCPEENNGSADGKAMKERKDHMTKAQKRRMFDKYGAGGNNERPRGWDWIDIVKHLSQTGGKQES